MTQTIYHITSRAAWDDAQTAGEYRAESLDSQGFIHLSQAHQVLGVLKAFYADQRGLVVLAVDVGKLKAGLKFESPVHPQPGESLPPEDELFPHLYGPLNIDAVTRVVDVPENLDLLRIEN